MSKIKAIDGKPIIDAKRSLEIHVKPGDISRAKHKGRKDPTCCVLARAMHRQTHCADVRIHLSRTYVRHNKGNWQRYLTSGSLRTEIIAFDRGGEFEPGAYTLGVPTHLAAGKRQGSGRDRRKGKSHRRTATIVKNVRTGPA